MTGAHIVAIVAIVLSAAYAIVHLVMRNKAQAKEKTHNEIDEVRDELRQELKEVKERLAVLEKIVTDEKYDLKKEINSL